MKVNANQLEALLLEFYDLRELAWLEGHMRKDKLDREDEVPYIYQWTVEDYARSQGLVVPDIKQYHLLYKRNNRKV